MEKITILALSGSLRKMSLNTAALNTLQKVAPDYVDISVFPLGDIPLFNPDREGGDIHVIEALKAQLRRSQGLIIASPEYAHGVTGVIKNTLDWLVSGDEFVDKPIMLINTSPRATHAQASLKEILTTMSGRLIDRAHVTVPLLGSGLNVDMMVGNDEITTSLETGLSQFYTAICETA
ncbi:NAD(P)H-dependent oxidoreductase [Marinomonas sp.]|nr:NADPH-dependent FMN reductase [Marinomonas sp.]MDB4837903.1 NAD(P)H-dependent oxidoreductase [Marinomonas sp.]